PAATTQQLVQPRGQLVLLRGVLRLPGQVLQLERVMAEVVQLAAAVGVLHVVPGERPQRVEGRDRHRVAAAVLAVVVAEALGHEVRPPAAGVAAQQRQQALAIHRGRDRQPGQRQQRRGDVRVEHHVRVGGLAGGQRRVADHQRHPQALLVGAVLLVQPAVLAPAEAVVAQEDDHRVVELAAALQHPAQPRHRVVHRLQGLQLVDAELVALGHVAGAQQRQPLDERRLVRDVRLVVAGRAERGQGGELAAVAVGRGGRGVGGEGGVVQEERLAAGALDELLGLLGQHVGGVVGRLRAVRLQAAVDVEGVVVVADRAGEGGPGVPAGRDVGWRGVGAVAVEVLAEQGGAVAGVVQAGGQGGAVAEGGHPAVGPLVAQHAVVAGELAGQDGGAAGAADRGGDEGVGEGAPHQALDGGHGAERVPALVVGQDQHDVRPRRGLPGRGAPARRLQPQQHERQRHQQDRCHADRQVGQGPSHALLRSRFWISPSQSEAILPQPHLQIYLVIVYIFPPVFSRPGQGGRGAPCRQRWRASPARVHFRLGARSRPMTSLQIRLFGSLRVETGDGRPLALGYPRARVEALLAALVLHRPRPLSRARLAALLWPDALDARASLRRVAHALRRSLPPDVLLEDRQTIGWNPAACWLDVQAFEALLDQGDEAALEAAVGRYHGDLLEDLDHAWIVPERERLRARYLDALGQQVVALRRARRFADAITVAQRLLTADPLREQGHQQLIALLALAGERAAALRQYERCREVLRAELDVEPLEETRRLRDRVLAGEALDEPWPAAPPRLGAVAALRPHPGPADAAPPLVG